MDTLTLLLCDKIIFVSLFVNCSWLRQIPSSGWRCWRHSGECWARSASCGVKEVDIVDIAVDILVDIMVDM